MKKSKFSEEQIAFAYAGSPKKRSKSLHLCRHGGHRSFFITSTKLTRFAARTRK
jgi:hypothetical protein